MEIFCQCMSVFSDLLEGAPCCTQKFELFFAPPMMHRRDHHTTTGQSRRESSRERQGVAPAMANDLQRCLKANWGHEKFRPHQLEVRNAYTMLPSPYFQIMKLAQLRTWGQPDYYIMEETIPSNFLQCKLCFVLHQAACAWESRNACSIWTMQPN